MFLDIFVRKSEDYIYIWVLESTFRLGFMVKRFVILEVSFFEF